MILRHREWQDQLLLRDAYGLKKGVDLMGISWDFMDIYGEFTRHWFFFLNGWNWWWYFSVSPAKMVIEWTLNGMMPWLELMSLQWFGSKAGTQKSWPWAFLFRADRNATRHLMDFDGLRPSKWRRNGGLWQFFDKTHFRVWLKSDVQSIDDNSLIFGWWHHVGGDSSWYFHMHIP